MLFSILKNCSLAELKELENEIQPGEGAKVALAETEVAQEKLRRKMLLK